MISITIVEHPLLDAGVFEADFGKPIAELPSPSWLTDLLVLGAEAPLQPVEEVRKGARDLLRHGGYKPTGRGKPASEYLVRAAGDGSLGNINAAVDVCNVVSLHSGLPISVVDLDLASAPFRLAIADAGSEYVFNPAGQVIKLDGLLCLHDAVGACANGVKDSQRTKTREATQRALYVIWGTRALEGRTAIAAAWARELLERLGATVTPCPRIG